MTDSTQNDTHQTVNAEQALVVFTPSGRRGRFPVGSSLLQAARSLGVDIDSVCGGRGICGRCQVLVSEGDFAKHGICSTSDNLSPFSEPEQRFSDKRGLETGRRLSCHTRVEGDVVIDVPAESQVHHQVVRKAAEVCDIQLDPLVHPYLVEVREPDMHDPSGDLQRLQEALQAQWSLSNLRCHYSLLPNLQAALRKGKWQVTAVVRQANEGFQEIVAVWPGLKENLYGIAVDVGSTTVAAHLCDLHTGDVVASSGLMNPQIRFGEDLMSRVSYVMMNPGGEKEMTLAVRQALDKLAGDLCREVGIEREDVMEITLVGNPIMHHLLLGINPVELGGAPFALATDSATLLPARELDLNLNAAASAYILPCIAGHVGADTAGVILAEAPFDREEMTLIVDVGTNAEIVLGNKERLLACSSPTGPAFEGAQISCGQRAAPGAIERVRIDPETLEPRFKVIGSDLWSDEPGFEDHVKQTGITGVCGSGIIEVIGELYLAGIINQDGLVDGSLATRSDRIQADGRTFSYLLHAGEPRLMIQQNDIRAIQLAKAALYAGVRLLMEKLGIEKVERIRLAGAFGSHIDVKYAMLLGLIPDCDLAQVSSAGNAAGTGARIALLDRSSRAGIEARVRQIEKIETAVEATFQQHFVEAMAIPHKVDPFEQLSQVVKLPAIKVIRSEESKGRVRRRGRQSS
jgi:uncharacterized 2Fe-2S/4Fe-4S cluster protein (DUF4445 family)